MGSYVESHDENYRGHSKVVRASLTESRSCFELRGKEAVEVMFKTSPENYNEVARILQIMIPDLEIVGGVR